ncbi:hypothetical protein NSQ59_01505 [Margalitia sp. FSL K6-0131]|uniref:hypothetical protein n=1 Tax=Margalitia sp. FSL K6-0131 TaxID=2954604 RepID=UPI0030F540F6
MKKLLVAVLLLLISLIYVIVQVTKKLLYLPKFSIKADNPVSFHWSYIDINTGFQQGDPGSIYHLWMIPVYLLILIALILTALAFRKNKN